jgi:hypothetical protein
VDETMSGATSTTEIALATTLIENIAQMFEFYLSMEKYI